LGGCKTSLLISEPQKSRVTVAAMRRISKHRGVFDEQKLLSYNRFFRFSTIAVDKPVRSVSTKPVSGMPDWGFCLLPNC
jgi:hypothetical protein